jgi:hypothetical protein
MKKRLQLRKVTLRTLDDDALKHVAGGATYTCQGPETASCQYTNCESCSPSACVSGCQSQCGTCGYPCNSANGTCNGCATNVTCAVGCNHTNTQGYPTCVTCFAQSCQSQALGC